MKVIQTQTDNKVDKTNVAIFACRYSDMNTLMQNGKYYMNILFNKSLYLGIQLSA